MRRISRQLFARRRGATESSRSCLGAMTKTPRWPLGSNARMVHALAVVLAFELLVTLSRLVIVPALGGAIGKLVVFALCFGGVIGWLLLAVGRVSLRDLGYVPTGLPRELGRGALGAVAISALLLGWIFVCHGAAGVAETLARIASWSPMDHVAFAVVGLLASAAEETVFRGYLQPALMSRLGAAAGIVLTMVIFNAGHHTSWPALDRVGALVITGLVLGVLRGQDRPIIASFAAHTLVWTMWGNA